MERNQASPHVLSYIPYANWSPPYLNIGIRCFLPSLKNFGNSQKKISALRRCRAQRKMHQHCQGSATSKYWKQQPPILESCVLRPFLISSLITPSYNLI